MNRFLLTLASLLGLVTPAIAIGAEPSAAQLAFFEKRIRPVLVAHCFECHSAEAAARGKLKGGLALDTRMGLLQGGDSGPAIVAGEPENSLLLDAMRYGSYEMPPSGRLPDPILADFEKWIEQGAADPRDGAAVATREDIDWQQARQFWSLQPVRRPAVPAVVAEDWPFTPIDRFVLARLEQNELQPHLDAEARTLARRLYFDLVGLPPTPEQLSAFLENAARDRQRAIADLVDQLLASPQFGQRWGRHWLDVVRYADSNGRDVNVVWYDAWRYRDWVIDALNDDLPYNEFLRHQIAGDLLSAESREQRDRQRIATGLLAMTPKMIGEQNKQLFLMDVIDEQIDVISRGMLGLSISCARCHDHKFDPVPTSDYYALAGIFRSSEPLYGFGRVGVKNSPHTDLIAIGPSADSLAEEAIAFRHELVDRHLEFQQARSARYGVVRRVADAKLQAEKPGADAAQFEADIARMESEIAEWDEKIRQLEEALHQRCASPPPEPDWAMGIRDVPQPADCRIHIRGETTNLSDRVPRGVPQLIVVEGLEPIDEHASGRLQLADWLASDQNPLTRRVAVNRIWMRLMGRGLVATADDFGMTGAQPSHPELLDWLSHQFAADGWSVKRLIRHIVLSRTYQLASAAPSEPGPRQAFQAALAADPDNVLLWRFRPRPLEVEAFRDAVLSVSGKLDVGSPAEQFLDRWNRYEHDKVTSFKPFVTPDDLEHRYRSVYLPVIRGSLPELFELFDFADPNRCVVERDESTLPAQSLFLMNSPWMIERATWTANRVLADPKLTDDAARIERLFLLALGRLPTAREQQDGLRYLSETQEQGGEAPSQQVSTSPGSTESAKLAQWISYCQIMFASGSFRYVE